MEPRTRVWSLLLGMLALGLIVFIPAAWAQEKAEHAAVKPVPRDGNWMKRHEGFVEIAKKGDVDVLFIGDSITDAWRNTSERDGRKIGGKNVWDKHFASLKAANFGIGGDRTQHVLWRLQNGELEGIKPKVVVLMIGTNNSNGNDHTGAEIADGITAIVKEIQKRSPTSKVLLLGVFPRGKDPSVGGTKAQREKLAEVNKTIAMLDDGKGVKYLDIGAKFLDKDRTISQDIMYDALHLTEKGYETWAENIIGPLKEMLGK